MTSVKTPWSVFSSFDANLGVPPTRGSHSQTVID
jgi:hypothetical protein